MSDQAKIDDIVDAIDALHGRDPERHHRIAGEYLLASECSLPSLRGLVLNPRGQWAMPGRDAWPRMPHQGEASA